MSGQPDPPLFTLTPDEADELLKWRDASVAWWRYAGSAHLSSSGSQLAERVRVFGNGTPPNERGEGAPIERETESG